MTDQPIFTEIHPGRVPLAPEDRVRPRPPRVLRSGGERRDARLAPIVDRLKNDLMAIALDHGAVRKYSPDQPREPAGTPEGGEFASSDGRLSMADYNALSFSDRFDLPDDKKPWPRVRQSLNPGNDRFGFLPGALLSSAYADGGLTQVEKDALMDYTRSSTSLNNVLRFGRTTGRLGPDAYFNRSPDTPEQLAKYQEQAKTIDQAIQEKGITSDQEQLVFRGVDGRTFTGLSRGFDKVVGQVIEDKGFLSTLPPMDRGSTKDFGSVDLRIAVPPGVPHVEINGNSEGEEWLFGTGSKLRVDAYYPRDYGTRPTFDVTMLP